MIIPLCRHIFPGGTLCQGAAVHDTYFCRHHQFVKTTLALASQPVAYGAPPQLPFVFAEDRAAIQLNLMMVLKALNDGKIDSRTANTMTRVLNSCMRNLKAGLLTDPNAKDVARTVITTPDGEEIAPPREAPEDSGRDAAFSTQQVASNSLNVVIPSEATERSAVEGPAVRDESSTSDHGADQPTPDNPYADLYHLPSPEFAYRVYERATQIHEAKRAAQREESARPESASADAAEESAEPAVNLTGAIQIEEPAAASVATTAAHSEADEQENEAARERRFREWQQSPQGQDFERMYCKPDPHPDTAQPGCAARIQAAIDAGFEPPVYTEFAASPDLGALSQKRGSSATRLLADHVVLTC